MSGKTVHNKFNEHKVEKTAIETSNTHRMKQDSCSFPVFEQTLVLNMKRSES